MAGCSATTTAMTTFETYEALFEMFDREVKALWRKEDEESR